MNTVDENFTRLCYGLNNTIRYVSESRRLLQIQTIIFLDKQNQDTQATQCLHTRFANVYLTRIESLLIDHTASLLLPLPPPNQNH